MGNAISGKGIPESAHHRILTDEISKAVRAVLAGENLVGLAGFAA